MGAAGKRREEELLAQIAALEAANSDKEKEIKSYEARVEALNEHIRMKEQDIKGLEEEIANLQAKIADLESQLNSAMQSGDEASKALRKQLQELQETFEIFKNKSR